jgi:hypothetical protein
LLIAFVGSAAACVGDSFGVGALADQGADSGVLGDDTSDASSDNDDVPGGESEEGDDTSTLDHESDGESSDGATDDDATSDDSSLDESDSGEESESTSSSSTGDSSDDQTSQSSSESSTDTSSDTSSDPGDGCGIIACNPGDPKACAAGEKCTPYRCTDGACCTDSTRCVAITGDKKGGDSCERDGDLGIDDCAPGYFCSPMGGSSGGSGKGWCQSLCNVELGQDACADRNRVDAGALEDGQMHCFAWNGGSLPLCGMTCNPLRPDCDSDEACFLVGDAFLCSDIDKDHHEIGEPCFEEETCAEGLSCISHDLLAACMATCNGPGLCGCCAQTCELNRSGSGTTSTCESPKSCKPLPFEPVGAEQVGFCD